VETDMLRRMTLFVLAGLTLASLDPSAQKYTAADGHIRVALAKQPFSPTGLSKGPTTMAEGGIQKTLADIGATIRIQEARLTPEEDKEYGGWKRLGYALGHFADLVSQNERDGYLTVGLLATCPSMPGSSPDSNALDRASIRCGSACSGWTPIPISTPPRQPAAVRSVGCPSPSRRDGRFRACGSMRSSIRRSRIDRS
jgi:hypothetical protein